jgi:hypothetical protein
MLTRLEPRSPLFATCRIPQRLGTAIATVRNLQTLSSLAQIGRFAPSSNGCMGTMVLPSTSPDASHTEAWRSNEYHVSFFPTACTFCFCVLPPEHFVCGKLQIEVAAVLILGFSRCMTTRSPHKSRRTSCVLCIPRIPRDARYSQHAWQGFHPVHPTKEGACPLCWILPRRAAGGRI